MPGNSSLSYLDSLKEHKIDILVLDHPDDNIPEDMEDSCYVSHTIRNNIHWVTSSADPTLLSMINVWLEDFMGSRLYKRTASPVSIPPPGRYLRLTKS